jgi:hypothetical protein
MATPVACTMDELIGDSLSSRGFATLVLAVCAAIGLLLAVSGIYSIVTRAVIQQRFVGPRSLRGLTGCRCFHHLPPGTLSVLS